MFRRVIDVSTCISDIRHVLANRTRLGEWTRLGVLHIYEETRLKSTFKQFNGRHNELMDHYGLSMSQVSTDLFPPPSRKTLYQFNVALSPLYQF